MADNTDRDMETELSRRNKMKEIPLTQGKVSLVDDQDYDELMKYKWCADKVRTKWYATRGVWEPLTKTTKKLRMHQVILKDQYTKHRHYTDHINHDTLDNRRRNLRVCTNSENMRNCHKSHNTSGYIGVVRDKKRGKWLAQIGFNWEHIFIGRYDNIVEAAKAVDKKARELFGEYALLNFPGGEHGQG
jgi:hypothetical protein